MVRPYMSQKGNIRKVAFNLNVDPSSILGALTGGFIAKKTVEKNLTDSIKDSMMPQRLGPAGHTGYLRDFNNLEQNLQIVFTPLGVIYVVKDGPREYAVDQISVSDMNENIMERFNQQDRMFFKNVLLNKVRADINMAERVFAGRMIDQKLAFDISDMEKEASERTLLALEKFAESEETIRIPVNITDSADINKIAFLADIKGFFGPKDEADEMAKIQGNLADPDYLAKKVDIGFMPDRVLFIADGLVISQMNVMDMNTDGFQAFQENNDKYFIDFFRGKIKPMKEVSTSGLFKKASEIADIGEIFVTSMIHPMVYKIALDSGLGAEWVTMDPEVIIKSVEDAFMLTEPIEDSALNKILTIASANNPDPIVFENMFAFEKAIRAMADKPIDFEEDERNISLGEIIFGIKCLQEITPFKDITEVMSEGVLSYIIDVLASQGYRLVYPDELTSSEAEMYAYIDKEVRETVIKHINSDVSDRATRLSKSRVISNIISKLAKDIVDHFRINGMESLDEIDDKCIEKWDRIRSVMKEDVEDLEVPMLITIKAVHDNIAVDVYMAQQEAILEESISKFNLGGDQV